jgi:zinc protease
LNGSAGHHALTLTGTFLSTHLEKGLQIFLDALVHPVFPEAELERKRKEILTNIKNRDERFRNQAFQLFYQTLFRKHPYRLDLSGQRDSISRFDRQTLIDYYQTLLIPGRTVVAVVGDIESERVLDFLKKTLSRLPDPSPGLFLPASENNLTEPRAEKKNVKSMQAHMVLGFLAPAMGEPDYFIMKVVQTILSGMGGRLFVQLRDRSGLAYSVSAFTLDDPVQGAFGIYAATDPANVDAVKKGLEAEIHRLKVEEAGLEELERAKKALLGGSMIYHQTHASRAAQLALNDLFGLGYDFDQAYRDRIESVTAADVRKFAQRYLSLDRHALAILGPLN